MICFLLQPPGTFCFQIILHNSTIKNGLTPQFQRNLCFKVSVGEGGDAADVDPFIRDVCVHEDQGGVLDGIPAFEADPLGPFWEN